MDGTAFFDRYFSDEDYEEIGRALSSAYKACDELIGSSVVLSGFGSGMQMRGRLISPFVEYALTQVPGIRSAMTLNAAKNFRHAVFYKHNQANEELALTAHFMGENPGNARGEARSALNRAAFAERNLDLFAEDESCATDPLSHTYAWILHAGSTAPRYAYLAVPSPEQRISNAVRSLPLLEAEKSDVEDIRDRLELQFRSEAQGNAQQSG